MSTSKVISSSMDFSLSENGGTSDENGTANRMVYSLPPEQKWPRGFHKFRYSIFQVYRRLFSLVFIGNITGLLIFTFKSKDLNTSIIDIASAASANLFVAVAMRQDYIINLLCEACVCVPKGAPLQLRRVIAKVYEFGGVHSGASFCALAWLSYIACFLTKSATSGAFRNVGVIALAYILVMIFIGTIIFAYPTMRRRAHNTFERTHRFAGWTANLLFWTLILIAANDIAARAPQPRSLGGVLVTIPSFYLLTANTIHTILPWLRIRRLPTIPEPLSPNAVRLHLKANIAQFYTIRISDSPLSEWHSFACFPDKFSINGSTNSVIIAKAGDWTSKTIVAPLPSYWTRGLPTRGVLYLSLMFRKIVVVTTGSGIGPCLNLLAMEADERPRCRVLWSTPRPLETFGQEILDTVKEADSDALIWDTKVKGRPDMLSLTWQLYKESESEAVFVISNPKVTKLVVYGLESRGVPAFGPVFDS